MPRVLDLTWGVSQVRRQLVRGQPSAIALQVQGVKKLGRWAGYPGAQLADVTSRTALA